MQVADVTDDAIIGQGLLESNKITLDLGNRVMRESEEELIMKSVRPNKTSESGSSRKSS